jgi:hypothetical protein
LLAPAFRPETEREERLEHLHDALGLTPTLELPRVRPRDTHTELVVAVVVA